jgi:DNA-binding IclR family transcriptional regulator
LAAAYLQQVTLHTVAMPLLRQLAASCQETCHLAVLDGMEVVFIDQVESPRSITLRSHAGVKLPAYCTGAGKMLLAHLDEEELNLFLGAVKLEAFTENTITDRGSLKKHLEQIREQGFSVDNMEYQHEVRSAAAPVKDNTGQVIAAISIVGPGFRIKNPKTLEKHIAAARDTAARISRQLGYLEG